MVDSQPLAGMGQQAAHGEHRADQREMVAMFERELQGDHVTRDEMAGEEQEHTQRKQRPAAAQVPGQTQQSQHDSNRGQGRSEEHTSELQSLMRISYAV